MRSFDIQLARDGHYHEGWHLRDKDGVDLDLTGHTLSAVAQTAAGGAFVANAEIDLYDAAHGRFDMKWTGADFGIAGVTEIVRLSWKLRDAAPDGVTKDLARGEIILYPENS